MLNRVSLLTVVLGVSMISSFASAQMSPQQGRYFRFALPAGWTVNENPSSLSIGSPDGSIGIQHQGIAGLLQEVTPQQYVYSVLSRVTPDVRFVGGQEIQPPQGSKSAAVFEVEYTTNGTPCRGFVVANVAVGYRQCNAAMTIAACKAEMYPQVRQSLMQLAMAVTPSNGGAYTATAVAQQNSNNATREGQMATQYRNESNANWQAATNQRWESQDRNNWEWRQATGNATQYYNAYTGQLENYSSSNATYWQNPYTGQIVAGDSNFDPRTTADPNWQPMRQAGYQGR